VGQFGGRPAGLETGFGNPRHGRIAISGVSPYVMAACAACELKGSGVLKGAGSNLWILEIVRDGVSPGQLKPGFQNPEI